MAISLMQAMVDEDENFWRLLFRWKGSVYKLIWKDMAVYSVLYFTLSIVYRHVLSLEQRKTFEQVAEYCNYFSGILPVGFVLGFYVNIVVSRWWSQFEKIPFTDPVCLAVTTLLNGTDERSREMRRLIARYVNLAVTMLFFQISPSAKVRFPTKQHIVDAGLMTQREKAIMEEMAEQSKYVAYWLPLLWAEDTCSQALHEGKIKDTVALTNIMQQIEELRSKCSLLVGFDRHNIPLVYTQVVTMAVYAFCLSCIMGRQFFINPEEKGYEHRFIDIYIPLFTFLQFFFFLGWLKVAESLVHPFGEDDDDFEVNWILDKNMQVAFMMVDGKYRPYPEMVRDKYWTKDLPQVCPWPTPYPVEEQKKKDLEAERARSKGRNDTRRGSMFNFMDRIPCNHRGSNTNIRGRPDQSYSPQRLSSQLGKNEASSPKTTSNFTSTTSIPSCCSHASPQVRHQPSCVDDGNTIASFSQNYQDPSMAAQNTSPRQNNPSLHEKFQKSNDNGVSIQNKKNYIPSMDKCNDVDNQCSSASMSSIDPTAPPLTPKDISSASSSPYDNSESYSGPPVGFCINSATPSPAPSPSMRNRSRSENPNLWDYTQSQSIPKNSASSPASLYPPHHLGDSFNASSSPSALYPSQRNEDQPSLNNSLKRGSLYYSATSNPHSSSSYSPSDNPQQSKPFQMSSPQFPNYSPTSEYSQINNNELRLRSNTPSPSFRPNTPSHCPETYVNMYPDLSDSTGNPLSISVPSNLNKTSPKQAAKKCDVLSPPSRPTSLDIPQHIPTMVETLENNSNFQPIQKHSPHHYHSPSSPQSIHNGNEDVSLRQNGRSNSLDWDRVLNT